MRLDALRDVVVHPERSGGVDQLPADELLSRLEIAACWAAALDAEQVVILCGQDALAPARLVDSLRDRDRRRDAVPTLGRHRTGRDLLDECALCRGARHSWRGRCGVLVPLIRRQPAWRRNRAMHPLEHPGDLRLAGPGLGGGRRRLQARARDVGAARLPAVDQMWHLAGAFRPVVPARVVRLLRLRDHPRGVLRPCSRPSVRRCCGFRARFGAGLGQGPRQRQVARRYGPRRRDCPRRQHRLRRSSGRGARRRRPRRLARGLFGTRLGPRLRARNLRCQPVVHAGRSDLAAGLRSTSGPETVVHKADDALAAQRTGILVGVHREVRQGIPADGVQHTTGVLGHDLNMTVEEHPIAGLRLIAIAKRVPPLVVLGVLQHRRNLGRCRVRSDPGIHPVVQRPRVARAARYPALLAHQVGPQLQGQARERRAGGAVVGAIQAVVLPDDRLHLGRGLPLGQAQVVAGNVDDRGPEHGVVAGRSLRRLLQRHQRKRQRGRRRQVSR